MIGVRGFLISFFVKKFFDGEKNDKINMLHCVIQYWK